MTNFEHHLHDVAKQIVEEQNKHLKVPEYPVRDRRTYWGWIATPVAAVVGVLFGMFLSVFLEQTEYVALNHTDSELQKNRFADTVYFSRIDTQKVIIHDTIYQTKWIERVQKESVQEKLNNGKSECTSVQCDGINYALLVSN